MINDLNYHHISPTVDTTFLKQPYVQKKKKQKEILKAENQTLSTKQQMIEQPCRKPQKIKSIAIYLWRYYKGKAKVRVGRLTFICTRAFPFVTWT